MGFGAAPADEDAAQAFCTAVRSNATRTELLNRISRTVVFNALNRKRPRDFEKFK
jgi:ATP-dependent Clp protease ATP-binding subunit ClpA